MIQTNEIQQGTPLTTAEFYDALAPEYDRMTGFRNRFVQERPFFRLLVGRYKIRTALDAGCGTGFHSLLLAQLGVRMTGVDVSPAMIQEARRHAAELSLPVDFIEAPNENLHQSFDSRFDAVFSLGNTTAHALSEEALHSVFRSFHEILKPKGILFLQNLNYDRILARKERIQSIKEMDGATFIRLYDYDEQFVTFNILAVTRNDGVLHPSMRAVQLKPLTSAQIAGQLMACGFGNIRLFGSIAMDTYDPQTSRDLVVIAEKEETE